MAQPTTLDPEILARAKALLKSQKLADPEQLAREIARFAEEERARLMEVLLAQL